MEYVTNTVGHNTVVLVTSALQPSCLSDGLLSTCHGRSIHWPYSLRLTYHDRTICLPYSLRPTCQGKSILLPYGLRSTCQGRSIHLPYSSQSTWPNRSMRLPYCSWYLPRKVNMLALRYSQYQQYFVEEVNKNRLHPYVT